MLKFIRLSVLLAVGFIVWTIFSQWFSGSVRIGGDWPFYFKETLANFSTIPTLWTYGRGGGLGGVSPVMNLDAYERFLFQIFVQTFSLDFTTVFFYGWFGLFLFLSITSSYIFSRLVHTGVIERAITVLVFLTNTYVLMLVGGGQMGVALSYVSTPFMLTYFIRLIRLLRDQKVNLRSVRYCSLKLLLSIALVIFFDPRIAFVVCIALGVYLLVSLPEIFARGRIVKNFITLSGVFVLALGLNGFWLIPENITKDNPLSGVASSVSLGSVKFFSFADFSHALSLLHPNWSENIFGKTYFLDSVFLFLPFLAFLALLGIFRSARSKNISAGDSFVNKIQVYFIILALIGVFLSKGTNPPFGIIYEYLFTHVPGFVLFRDPTKFYILTILSYSILIPIGIKYISGLLEYQKYLKWLKIYLFPIIVVIFLLSWTYMVRPALTGNLGGTFSKHTVPSGFQDFQSVLLKDDTFSRTLWVPRQSRFSYYDSNHPPVELSTLSLATTSAEFSIQLQDPVFQKKLIASGIGYLVVPADPLGELFVEERKYSQALRDGYVQVLESVPWLTKIANKDLEIYKTQSHNDLFTIQNVNKVQYVRKNDANYEIILPSGENMKLLFSQAYNSGWALRYNSLVIKPEKTEEGLMALDIPSRESTVRGEVVFEPDSFRTIGYIVSMVSVVLIILILVFKIL